MPIEKKIVEWADEKEVALEELERNGEGRNE